MCKGCNIHIKKIDARNKLADFFGAPLVISSDFNFPRACDYSFAYQTLAVCDTYHNRICFYDYHGNNIASCTHINDMRLTWPRCIKWVGEDLLIANSCQQQIICATKGQHIKWELTIDKEIAADEWIQAVDIYNDVLLVAFESRVIQYDLKRDDVVWTSESLDIQFSDIHHATYISDSILISDTGNNRLVLVHNSSARIIDCLSHNNKYINLRKPRMAMITDKKAYIVNSGTSQIYICDRDFQEIKYIYGGNRGLDYQRFSIPRWICPGPGDKIYISDTDNHRIALRKI